jgi:N-acetylglucosaminyl-diphospho-decaprenol L-rhamnosyltransferase
MMNYPPNKIDIVILNYNGAEILPLCLPSIMKAAAYSPFPCKVIILDNKSTDNSLRYVQNAFPQIEIVIAEKNKVLFSYNDLLPKLDSDIVLLMNNDIKVDTQFIEPLISHFSDPKVFGVSPKQMNFDGKGYNGGKNKIVMRFGLIQAGQDLFGDDNPKMEQPGYTYYNANSAFDRKKFIELGGFDEIYAPFTWEDTDICYRAWKTGLKIVYEPKSVIYHNESYTFDKEGKKVKNRRIISRRNSFIFTWKNINDPALLIQHVVLLPFNLAWGIIYDWARIAAFFQALLRLPRAISSRKRYSFKDREILNHESLR